ncbi:hypothetical protein ABKA04_003078 [Annulohypoxylon sp. FPYF3050]
MILAICEFFALYLTFQLVFTRYGSSLRAIPGPFFASFSNVWKVLAVYKDAMPQWNIAVHKKYGSVVRIGPKHVSFSSPEALQIIHGSRQAYPKDVNYHSSLKKVIGGLYTKAAVGELEPKIDLCMKMFIDQMRNQTHEINSTNLDISLWVHLFSFDCLGELNVSKTFGFMETGKDFNGMIEGSDRILAITGLYAQAPLLQGIRWIKENLWAPKGLNPVMKYTASALRERLEKPTETPDMLNNFLRLREAQPDKISMRDITGSIYINLYDDFSMAGHDVLAVTLRAILYYVARTPRVETKLRTELASLESSYAPSDIIPYAELTKLPYLGAVINESLRIHGNLGLVNERVTPAEGAIIDGFKIPGGTIVGINPWVIHRNTEIYGEDADVFRPERWLDAPEAEIENMKRNLFSFGAGPRITVCKVCSTASEKDWDAKEFVYEPRMA